FCILIAREVLRRMSARPARRYFLCIFLGVAIYIALLSFTRPAQRYLLFVLPLAYLFLMSKPRAGKYLTATAISIYAVLIVFITLNQIATGAVAQKMVQQLSARGWMADTDPGALIGTVGDLFADQEGQATHKPYIVVPGRSPVAIFTMESHPAPFVR